MEADASCKKWTEGRGPLWPRKGLGARRPQAHSQETPGWFWQNQIKAPIEEKKYLFIEEKEISFRPMPAGLGIVWVPQRTSWLPVSEVSLDEALSHCVNRAKKEQLDEKQRAQAMGPPPRTPQLLLQLFCIWMRTFSFCSPLPSGAWIGKWSC